MIPRNKIFNFHIYKKKDGWLIAKCLSNSTLLGYTQGRNEEEIMEMIADLYLTAFDVPVSWWNKLLYKLMIYRKK